MPRFVQPSFGLSRAGFVQPGAVYAEEDAGVAAWLEHVEAGRIAVDASARGVDVRHTGIEQSVDLAQELTVG